MTGRNMFKDLIKVKLNNKKSTQKTINSKCNAFKMQTKKGKIKSLEANLVTWMFTYVRVSVGIKAQILPHHKSNVNKTAEQGLSRKEEKT